MPSFYHLFTLSFFHLSLPRSGCLSLISIFSSLSSKMLSAVDETLQVHWKEAQAWNLSGHTQTHVHVCTHRHKRIPSLPGSQQNHTVKKKEASGETVKQNTEGSAFIPPLHPFTFHILSVVSPLSAFCLTSLISDPPRGIAAVKLLTSSSTSVMTLHSELNSVLTYVCVCEAVSQSFWHLHQAQSWPRS